MRDTLEEALDSIFGAAPPTLEQRAPGAPAPAPTTPTAPSAPSGPANLQVKALLDQAAAAFKDADDALKAGDLARYQADVNNGANLVRQAQQQAGGTTTTTPANTSA